MIALTLNLTSTNPTAVKNLAMSSGKPVSFVQQVSFNLRVRVKLSCGFTSHSTENRYFKDIP